MLRSILVMGASLTFTIGLSFVTIAIAARVISEQQLGLYYIALSVVYMLDAFTSLGLPISATKFIASAADDDERERTANTFVTFRLATTLLAMIVITVITLVARSLFPEELSPTLLYLTIIFFGLRGVENLLNHALQGFKKFNELSVIQAGASILNSVLAIVFLVVFEWGVEGLLLAWIFSLIATVLARYFVMPIRKRLMIDRDLVRKVVPFGLPLQGNDILTFIFQKADVLFLTILSGPTAVAFLEIASRIPSNIERLYQVLNSVYLPHMSEVFAGDRHKDAVNLLNYVLRLTTFLTMSAAVVVAMFQEELTVIIFSETYRASAPALGLLMISVGIGVANMVLDVGLIAKGRPIYMPIISIIDTVTVVGAGLVLISLFGFMGAVYAKVIANAVSNAASTFFLHREGITVWLWHYLKPLAYLVGLYAANMLLGDASSILVRLALIGVFFVLCFTTNVVSISEIMGLINSVLRRRVERPAV